MKPNRTWCWLSLIAFAVVFCVQFQGCDSLGSTSKKNDEAYVTLLYGDEFLLGVRVLGKSIRITRSNKDMVVLVSDGVSDYAKNLLRVIFSILSEAINDGYFSKFNFCFVNFVDSNFSYLLG